MGTHESWDNNHHHHYKTIKHDFKNKNQKEKNLRVSQPEM